MVQVFPFKAIRPEASLAEKVAELRMTWSIHKKPQRLRKAIPAISTSTVRDRLARIDPYDPQVYQKAAENLASFKKKAG